ncbi:hypothetical protein SEMRO_587_G171280.1 [Seminavis robusta]|uniref:Uncharacterized protein n=1 Tax=Seminavis robusta TaxID=568900 RepID=A0A9N8E3Q7_9STRA|nr:hypothetical protein SEMRO_587_G171280.1 [Seminavis robusta]|eukprot:Sro587_g171280.1 n/a (566) ;mRNA; r:9431-11235
MDEASSSQRSDSPQLSVGDGGSVTKKRVGRPSLGLSNREKADKRNDRSKETKKMSKAEIDRDIFKGRHGFMVSDPIKPLKLVAEDKDSAEQSEVTKLYNFYSEKAGHRHCFLELTSFHEPDYNSHFSNKYNTVHLKVDDKCCSAMVDVVRGKHLTPFFSFDEVSKNEDSIEVPDPNYVVMSMFHSMVKGLRTPKLIEELRKEGDEAWCEEWYPDIRVLTQDSLMKALLADPKRLIQFLAANLDTYTDTHDVRLFEPGYMDRPEPLIGLYRQFLSELVAHDVKVYPPNRVACMLNDKPRRDTMFIEHVLPHKYIILPQKTFDWGENLKWTEENRILNGRRRIERLANGYYVKPGDACAGISVLWIREVFTPTGEPTNSAIASDLSGNVFDSPKQWFDGLAVKSRDWCFQVADPSLRGKESRVFFQIGPLGHNQPICMLNTSYPTKAYRHKGVLIEPGSIAWQSFVGLPKGKHRDENLTLTKLYSLCKQPEYHGTEPDDWKFFVERCSKGNVFKTFRNVLKTNGRYEYAFLIYRFDIFETDYRTGYVPPKGKKKTSEKEILINEVHV